MSTLKTNNVQVGQSATATNNFTWYQPSTPDGTVRLGVGNSGATTADVITANSSGNVGIGTSSPAGYKLAVESNNANLYLKQTTGDYGSIIGQRDDDGALTFSRRNGSTVTERARIDSNGNLLLGSTNSNSGAFKFKVQAATDVCLLVSSGTNIAGAMTLNAVNDANSANIALDFRASSIYASSGIGTTASAANAFFDSGNNNRFLRSTSALKYKTNIRDLESIDISKFRPVRYNSLCEADDPNKEHFGLIADEVDAAGIKELVSYGLDGEIEGFQYDRLTVVLLKAIQELNAKVEAQAAEIAALKSAT